MPMSFQEMARRVKIHLIRNRSRQIAGAVTASVFLVSTFALGLQVTSALFVPWLMVWGLLARLSDQAALFYAESKILGYAGS